MPMTKNGKVIEEELPSTVQRSDEKAKETFAKAHDSAVEEYGDGQRAHQTAYATLKRTHEKVGDHWEPKDHAGPSDAQAAGGRDTDRETAEGVDANATKEHLYDIAQRLDIEGRSDMDKDELIEAIQKENRRETAESRDD